MVKVSSTIAHEATHWFQFAGTAWGNLCLLAVQEKLNLLYDEKYAPLYAEIQRSVGKLRFDESLQYDTAEFRSLPFEIRSFILDWRDLQVGSLLFSQGPVGVSRYNRISGAVSETLAAISLRNRSTLGWSSMSYEDLLQRHSMGKPAFVGHGPDKLFFQVSDLFECQAASSQVLYIAAELGPGALQVEPVASQLKPLLGTSEYWRALRLYQYLSGDESRPTLPHLLIQLAKVCILVDVSLAVPTEFNSESYTRPDWDDFYPTSRFWQACKAASDYEEDFELLEGDHHQRFEAYIYDKLGWRSANELSKSQLTLSGQAVERFEEAWEGAFEGWENAGINIFLHCLFSKFSAFRQRSPLCVQNLGLGSSSRFGQLDLMGHFMGSAADDNWWAMPPFLLLTDEKGFEFRNTCRPNSVKEYWLLFRVLAANTLLELVGRNEVDYPFSVVPSIRADLAAHLEQAFQYRGEF